MTRALFREDSYLRQAVGTVTAHTEQGGVILDASIFYPNGGGQPGDTGRLQFADGEMIVTATIKGQGSQIVLLATEGASLPPVGAEVTQILDWQNRNLYMRIHTALHLLSVVIPLPVTGGQISVEKGRLDFDMPDALDDKQAVEDALNVLIAQDFAISQSWITDAELAAQPDLVKTMSVQPPTGSGRVRLIRIGNDTHQVDLQPCGGTHVARTSEIGPVTIGKIEKKGRQNRRVNMFLAEL
ncbi:MAG: alanyl-tRNA editing protein [Rhodobacterales bacterium]|jgi:misacylated tRNA(Ala) deacylase|nr:alanyl-tRNA editing protein [Rhodobacter sp.]